MFVLQVKMLFVNDVKIFHLLGTIRQRPVKFVHFGLMDELAHPLVQALSEFAPETEKEIYTRIRRNVHSDTQKSIYDRLLAFGILLLHKEFWSGLVFKYVH